jgi:5-guanidino-2-oxopentanoate decarboxylase
MSRNVGGYLVELLVANDIDTVFGIPGVHNLELYRGLTSANIRHVLVRHEQGAGFAADGFARLSGRPAAAFVISGPGLTNIMTAVAQAYSDSVPLLVVASAPARATFGKQWGVLHELYDQAALAAGVFGIARSARSAEDVRDHLRLCLASFRTGRPRPAYLEIPLDVLTETTTLEAHRFEGTPLLPQASADQIGAAVRLLSQAARPLIIAGGGARRAGAELHRLVETLDCPLVTTAAGKGVLADSHPANLGTSLPYRPIQQLIFDADVVLAVGTELGETDMYFTTKLPLGGLLIRVDVDPVKLSDQYAADVCVWSDARSALHSINHALGSRTQDAVTRNRRSREISFRDREQLGFEDAGPVERAARHQERAALGRRRVQRHDANRLFRELRISGRQPRTMVPPVRLRHLGVRAAGGARRQDLEPGPRRHRARGRLRAAIHPT